MNLNNCNTSVVSEETAVFLSQFQRVMKSKGFTRTHNSIASALYDMTFTRGKRKISISGWHGTGRPGTNRYFGSLKSFLAMYDNRECMEEMHRKKRIIDIDSTTGTVEQHTANMRAALLYAHEISNIHD